MKDIVKDIAEVNTHKPDDGELPEVMKIISALGDLTMAEVGEPSVQRSMAAASSIGVIVDTALLSTRRYCRQI